MSWRSQLLTRASALGRATYEHALGVGVEFEDGCDAFWVLPGEVTSTVPIPAEGPASVDELVARYDDINRIRERALHAIRHHLAAQSMKVARRRDGEWGLEFAGGSSSSMSVGASLTAVARDTGDVHAVVHAAFEHSWIKKPESREQVERYLATLGPPASEFAPGEGPPTKPITLVPQTIREALVWLGLCRALDAFDEETTPQSFAANMLPTGRIAQAILRMGERLPSGVTASNDLLKPGTVSIDFDGDPYRGSFDIRTRSRELAKRVADAGPHVVGDQLAVEFMKLRAGRRAVFGAIHHAAAARGWRKQEVGLFFFGIEQTVFLGQTHREITFRPDAVNELLRTGTAESALRAMLAGDREFADAAVAALENLPADAHSIVLPDAALMPRDIPPAPLLRTLTDKSIAVLDDFAKALLEKYLAGNERAIWEYRNPDVYDAATDTWATPADWVRLAERHINDEWVHPMAIVILLDANDPRGDSAARTRLAKAEPHHEVGDEEVELAWRYRHTHPEVARKWFAPRANDDVPFFEARAKLGDPVAARKVTLGRAADNENDGGADVMPDTAAQLAPDRQDALHRDLLTWARTTHQWSPPTADKLRIAVRMGWRDVADALADNPYLHAGLLSIDRRSDMFDEPGMLLAKDFLLVWSRLAPSRFLAQLVATAYATDLVALAEEAGRRSAAGKPDVQKNLAMSAEIYRNWLADTQIGTAIAWTRCRSLLR